MDNRDYWLFVCDLNTQEKILSQASNDFLLDGCDVHVWDDGRDWIRAVDCDEWGEGRALNMVANAINNHGQSQVAMIGYSHGGGSTYNLSQSLAFDGLSFTYVVRYDDFGNPIYNAKKYEDRIHQDYSVAYTSYIDAINNHASLATSPETRRPEASQYHVNQYQQNTVYLGGRVPLNGDHSSPLGDIDEDRSGWLDRNGQRLTHSTIDDDKAILNVVTDSFEGRVSR